MFTAVLSACELTGVSEKEGTKYRLTASARSATTLQLQWDAIGSASRYTVDYLRNQTTCDFPPGHSNVQEVSGTSVTLAGLLPETLYQIHVHELPNLDEVTNVILIRTLAAGVPTQAVLASDYTICN